MSAVKIMGIGVQKDEGGKLAKYFAPFVRGRTPEEIAEADAKKMAAAGMRLIVKEPTPVA